MDLPSQYIAQTSKDMKVVYLSDFERTHDHISLLQKGMSFSPVANMDEFTVYKDVALFLRKAFLRSLYEGKGSLAVATLPLDEDDQLALDTLNSLLADNEGLSQINSSIRRKTNLRIRSQKMLPLLKNKWLQIFLDLVQPDLEKVNWTQKISVNLTADERRALNDLQKRKDIIIKMSDKDGNVVLLNQQHYKKEEKCLLNDKSTYVRLDRNPFPFKN